MNLTIAGITGQIEPAVLAQLASQGWQAPCAYYTRGNPLEAAWRHKSAGEALEMRWARREHSVAREGLPTTPQTVLDDRK
jgi:hypothetical protein